MAKIFITGSTDGLGLETAKSLLNDGHEVIVHGRNKKRIGDIEHLLSRGAKPVVGDLTNIEEQIYIAEQVNKYGQLDAVIHNAGIFSGESVFNVNVIAPYVLTALINKPSRLIYISSSMHYNANSTISNIDWDNVVYNYSDSKLFLTALSNAVSKRWSDTACYAVDPGWVPTKMGGENAPDNLVKGYKTQEWLATYNGIEKIDSGTYWYRKKMIKPHSLSLNSNFQNKLLMKLEGITNIII